MRATWIHGIPVCSNRDGDDWLVTDDKVYMYGVGGTIPDAIDDYTNVIEEYYKELRESEDKLGENLYWHLMYLRKHWERV